MAFCIMRLRSFDYCRKVPLRITSIGRMVLKMSVMAILKLRRCLVFWTQRWQINGNYMDSLRHSVKHYKASGMKYRLFIYLNLKVAYNFVNILVGHICDFLFVVDSKQIDASICCSYDHIQCDNPKASPLPPPLLLTPRRILRLPPPRETPVSGLSISSN